MSDLATAPPKIVRVVDVETTGLPEDEQHAICEIGWVDLDLDTMTIANPVTFYVNPGHSIPPHVRAIHHIGDADVAAAMRPDQALMQLGKGLGASDLFCAHNARFEQQFIGGDRQWLCTYKIGLRAWPEVISHSNQALRYELDIDGDPDFRPNEAMPPHRALPDAWVTAHILRRQLALRPIERLLEISGQPGFLTRMPMGKHHGKTFKWIIAEEPGYLKWCVDQKDMNEDVVFTAKWHLDKREQAIRDSQRVEAV